MEGGIGISYVEVQNEKVKYLFFFNHDPNPAFGSRILRLSCEFHSVHQSDLALCINILLDWLELHALSD